MAIQANLPVGWKNVQLSKILLQPIAGVSVNGEDRPASENEVGVLKTSAVFEGIFFPLENKAVLLSDRKRVSTPVKGEAILFNRANSPELVGGSAYIERNIPNLFLSDKLWLLEVMDKTRHHPRWVSYILCHPLIKAEIAVKATGSSKSMKNISKHALLSIKVPTPPIMEQIAIANKIATWDHSINLFERMIEVKKEHQTWLIQQLLTGRRCLPGCEIRQWKEHLLGELFKERRETNRNDLPLLSITSSRGVIPQEETEKIDTSNADKSNYKRIAPGDIGYNTMRMWQGVSALSTLEGIVSPAYTVCIPKRGILAEYARHLFKFPPMVHLFWRYSQGLVDDTLNLKFHNFAQIKVKLPGIPEQRKIAEILDTAASEIEQLQKQLEFLQKQKKGLMQQLLTGQIKVM